MSSTFSIETARSKFPSLSQKQVFFDNAGGSQTLGSVITSITEYLTNTNVQLGASYAVGKQATRRYGEGYNAAAEYINALPQEIVIGPSTTQLLRNLSWTFNFPAGSEIIISKLDHESNIAPWVSLAAQQNLTIKWWQPSSSNNPRLLPSDLKELLSPKTRLVSLTHSSNILGTISDIKAIAATVHENSSALVVVDAVAYAPHRQIDVRDLGVDFYCFSWYKVYGPHVSMLYASFEAQKSMSTLGHYFNPSSTLEDKMGLAGSSYELVYSIPQIVAYFGSGDQKRKSWQAIEDHERELQEILLSYLRNRKDVTIFGETSSDTSLRVSTISFKIQGAKSNEVVAQIEKTTEFGFRSGKFYSNRLAEDILGFEKDGAVRVSMVHYNTVDEIKEFVRKLDELFPHVQDS